MSIITHDLLKRVIFDQKEERIIPSDYIQRTLEEKLELFASNKEIIVITGGRRCGKSVLMHRTRNKFNNSNYYFNFEDERLITFTVNDFQILQEVLVELFGIQETFYFDEIQNIPGWELFVRRLYNNGNKIYITGSNANLFSKELGTHLTGRYIPICLYPISFCEYLKKNNSAILDNAVLSTNQIGIIKKKFVEYCSYGGIPEYIRTKHIDYIHSLYDSIIYRDIIARYNLSVDTIIKKLVFFLASNCSKEITYNSLRKLLEIGSTTTVSDYCGYLEDSYLCFFVNRYSDSVKAQLISPKKVYFIDHIIAKIVGFRIDEDFGRMLENIIFLELKRRNYEVYYYKGTKECDFIVRENNKVINAIQVCKDLSDLETKKREVNGLIEALARFSLKEGLIITENEELTETFEKNQQIFNIKLIPAWKWLLEYYYPNPQHLHLKRP